MVHLSTHPTAERPLANAPIHQLETGANRTHDLIVLSFAFVLARLTGDPVRPMLPNDATRRHRMSPTCAPPSG
ncbi:hypothetical protein B7R25_04155 [Subtercola boreus]|uniref:Uncharacterized protein n=1 Tax=Subtercola boreus TaxID=120213 RepID=A0A3E0WEL7_9MICO|nr:hypothetical protein B7R24_04145 [Subtercola boreus]RFA23154.1 hypothetical protein B7R23_04140 [Subtercola boreus]RFA28907.1 hypothetical protein B7R25_04155 [Subtercola boreus]